MGFGATLLLAGAACVEVEGAETVLAPGDHLLIPANASHRVTLTDPDGATIWLAMHFDAAAGGLMAGGASSSPKVRPVS